MILLLRNYAAAEAGLPKYQQHENVTSAVVRALLIWQYVAVHKLYISYNYKVSQLSNLAGCTPAA